MADGTLWCIKREGSNFVQELSGIVTISELGGRTMFQVDHVAADDLWNAQQAIHCTLETSDQAKDLPARSPVPHHHPWHSPDLFSHDHHLPPKPWQEGATFTNDTTGVGYTYTGGKWLASGGPKVDGEYVRKEAATK